MKHLEKVESKNTSVRISTLPKFSGIYGAIGVDEVKEALRGIICDTGVGPDKCCLSDIKGLSAEEVEAIFSKWWSSGKPDAAVKCRTSLLPKALKERDQVGNWRLITIGNLLMRIYGSM